MNYTLGEISAIKDIIYLKRTNPSKLIKLNRIQQKWAEMVGTHVDGKNPRTKILSAANKFLGKTCGSVQNIANVIWGQQNEFYNYPLYREWPFPKNIWIISSSAALREVIVPEMLQWFPKQHHITGKKRYWYKQGHKDYPYQWWTDTGFEIWLKSYDEDPDNFESKLVGLCLLSEPAPKQIYDAIPPRLSEGGVIMYEMTPLEGSGYAFEDLIDTGRAEVIYGDIWEGQVETGGRHSKESIQTWIDSIRNPDEIQPRVHGKPNYFQGAIFKTFNENIHVVPAKELTSLEQIWFVIDPHGSKPPFAQWWAINTAGELRCVLEFPKYEVDHGYETIKDTKLRIEDFCETFVEIEKEFDFERRVKRRIMDPFFGSKRYADKEYTVRDKFNKEIRRIAPNTKGFTFPPEGKTRSIQIGHQEIVDRLHFDLEIGRLPTITWEAHCMNSIRATKRYSKVIPKRLDETKDLASDSFKLTEIYKHAVDCCRYVVISNPSYEYQIGQNQKPKNWRDEVLNSNSTNGLVI